MGANGIIALIMLGMQALEQVAGTVSRISGTLKQGVEEGWTQEQWRQAAIDERARTNISDDATAARLDALINLPESEAPNDAQGN